MRHTSSLFWAEFPRPAERGGVGYLIRFARLAQVGKTAGHRLVSPADGTYRLVGSREILPTHSSTKTSNKTRGETMSSGVFSVCRSSGIGSVQWHRSRHRPDKPDASHSIPFL